MKLVFPHTIPVNFALCFPPGCINPRTPLFTTLQEKFFGISSLLPCLTVCPLWWLLLLLLYKSSPCFINDPENPVAKKKNQPTSLTNDTPETIDASIPYLFFSSLRQSNCFYSVYYHSLLLLLYPSASNDQTGWRNNSTQTARHQAMNTAADSYHDSAPAASSKASPAPSTAGSTGTSGITVRTGPNGQMSFRRSVVLYWRW